METVNVLMDFPDAMRAVQDKLAVRREAWDTAPDASVKLYEDNLCIFMGGQWRPWQITTEDVYGKDWMVP